MKSARTGAVGATLIAAAAFAIPSSGPASAVPGDSAADTPTAGFWPATVVPGTEQAVVLYDRVFLDGDTLTLALDSTSALRANGEIWRLFERPKKRPAPPPGTVEAWTDEFRARFRSARGSSVEERARQALTSMNKPPLDPTASATVSGNALHVTFLSWGSKVSGTIFLEPVRPIGDPDSLGRALVGSLKSALSRPGPAVWMSSTPVRGRYPFNERLLTGDSALVILPLLERAKAGGLTPSDCARARDYGFSPALYVLWEKAHR